MSVQLYCDLKAGQDRVDVLRKKHKTSQWVKNAEMLQMLVGSTMETDFGRFINRGW